MISVQEALSIVEANQPPSRRQLLALADAVGRVNVHDILAPEPSPRYTNSAMDGFAVRWSDVVPGSGPVRLDLIGESQAGVPFAGPVGPGQAVRINTGAMLPGGTDSVVPIEDAEAGKGSVLIASVSREHQHVRFRGSEFETGALIIPRNTLLNPSHVGLLASLGIHELEVFARPKLAILVTGSELADGHGPIEDFQIRDSNRPMLVASALAAGAELISTEALGDDLADTSSAVARASKDAEVIIMSGGVSVGEHDFVKPAVQRSGFETLIWRISQKPGKPLLVAKRNDTLLFGLPGNPVSAMMCFLYYVYPVIRRFNGLPGALPSITAQALDDLANSAKRAQFLRVELSRDSAGAFTVATLKRQASHMLTSLTEANGFVFLQAGETIAAGDQIDVMPFPWSVT